MAVPVVYRGRVCAWLPPGARLATPAPARVGAASPTAGNDSRRGNAASRTLGNLDARRTFTSRRLTELTRQLGVDIRSAKQDMTRGLIAGSLLAGGLLLAGQFLLARWDTAARAPLARAVPRQPVPRGQTPPRAQTSAVANALNAAEPLGLTPEGTNLGRPQAGEGAGRSVGLAADSSAGASASAEPNGPPQPLTGKRLESEAESQGQPQTALQKRAQRKRARLRKARRKRARLRRARLRRAREAREKDPSLAPGQPQLHAAASGSSSASSFASGSLAQALGPHTETFLVEAPWARAKLRVTAELRLTPGNEEAEGRAARSAALERDPESTAQSRQSELFTEDLPW